MRRFAWRRTACTFLVTAPLLAFGAASAAATVIHNGAFSGTEEFTEDGCGFDLDVKSTFSGREQLRVHKSGEAFLINFNVTFRNVWTNPETGKWFVVRGRSLFHEIKATHVDGDIYEFVAIEAGQPFVLEDSSGRVVVRDRGVIRFTTLFDTLGDGEPGGDFVEDVDIDIHGPHAGFDEDFPFCEIAAELTGA